MIHSLRNKRRFLASLALLAMLLRIAVPSGYMPSALADGWYLKLCSDGISSSAMTALLGQEDHSHHHHHGGDTQSSGSEQAFDQCDLGSGFASALVLQENSLALGLFILVFIAGLLIAAPLPGRSRLYLARGPPQALQI